MGVSMRQVLGVYMNKHFRSVKKWVRGEDLKGEPVEDKLSDVIVYALLCYKLQKEEMSMRPVPSIEASMDKMGEMFKDIDEQYAKNLADERDVVFSEVDKSCKVLVTTEPSDEDKVYLGDYGDAFHGDQ